MSINKYIFIEVMPDYNLYLNLRDSIYLNESLNHFGIIFQNLKFNKVNKFSNPTLPYIMITEGFIIHPEFRLLLWTNENMSVYYNDQLIFEKRINNELTKSEYHIKAYDLYIDEDREFVDSSITQYENNRKIFLFNTELTIDTVKTNTVAGLASGNYTARLAFNSQANNVIFYDFSNESLSFQQELLYSTNRYETYKTNLTNFTMGYNTPNLEDLNQLDMYSINLWYDYLSTINVKFMHIDVRNNRDVHRLFNVLPNNSTLWISNVLHYITTIKHDTLRTYRLLDKLSTDKDITILPHTRIYYES
jgi:hypothetical protein